MIKDLREEGNNKEEHVYMGTSEYLWKMALQGHIGIFLIRICSGFYTEIVLSNI